MDRGAWRSTVHGISKNRTGLSSHVCQQTDQKGNADVLNSGVLPPSSLCLMDPCIQWDITHSHKKGHIWISSHEWMNLEPVIQNEVSEKERNKFLILMHIYGI